MCERLFGHRHIEESSIRGAMRKGHPKVAPARAYLPFLGGFGSGMC